MKQIWNKYFGLFVIGGWFIIPFAFYILSSLLVYTEKLDVDEYSIVNVCKEKGITKRDEDGRDITNEYYVVKIEFDANDKTQVGYLEVDTNLGHELHKTFFYSMFEEQENTAEEILGVIQYDKNNPERLSMSTESLLSDMVQVLLCLILLVATLFGIAYLITYFLKKKEKYKTFKE